MPMRRSIPVLPALPVLALALSACGTDVSGPSATLLSCLFAEPRALDVGEVLQVRGEDSRSVCLSADTEADYLFIPFFAMAAPADEGTEVSLAVEITGGGFTDPVASAGEPAGDLLRGPFPDRLEPDHAFHQRLREREIAELGPRIRGPGPVPARDPAVSGAVRTLAVPAVGELMALNAAISCTEEDIRTGRVAYVSEHAVVVEDTANPVALAPEDYAFFGVTFDTLVYPVGTAHFGTPSDIDDNGRSIIFFTRAVNELTPPGAQTVVAGFFWSGDLFPTTGNERVEGCPAANQAEMFYMLAPDPGGTVGVPLTADDIRRMSVTVIGHEYQHLVNAARRLWVNNATVFERPWLNEGLSHIAEELLFYATTGLEPGRNLTVADVRAAPNGVWAFNQYMTPNFTNFSRYLAKPDTASLMGIDGLATRGATWSFLRYAAGRSGRADDDFFYDLVNATTGGLDNLNAVLGEAALPWMQDWTVSAYADDMVPGLDPRYAQASWDVHDVYQETLGRYPLTPPRLTSGQELTLELHPGGAAFPLFTVRGGDRAAVHVEADGGTPPASLRSSFIRIR